MEEKILSFIKIIKSLDEKQQIGLNLTLEGLNFLLNKTKSGNNNR